MKPIFPRQKIKEAFQYNYYIAREDEFEGDDLLNITIGRRPHMFFSHLFFFPFSFLLFAMFCTGIWQATMSDKAAKKMHPILEVIGFLVVGLMFLLLLYMIIYSTIELIKDFFKTRITIDCQNEKITIRPIPAITRSYDFSQIESVDLWWMRSNGRCWIWISLRVRGNRMLIKLFEAISNLRYEEDLVLKLSNEIAELFAQPMNAKINEQHITNQLLLFKLSTL